MRAERRWLRPRTGWPLVLALGTVHCGATSRDDRGDRVGTAGTSGASGAGGSRGGAGGAASSGGSAGASGSTAGQGGSGAIGGDYNPCATPIIRNVCLSVEEALQYGASAGAAGAAGAGGEAGASALSVPQSVEDCPALDSYYEPLCGVPVTGPAQYLNGEACCWTCAMICG